MTLNQSLQHSLANIFQPLGIVAYTNCCRIGCTGTYEDDDFEFRKQGIHFFRLSLNGMNYEQRVGEVYAHYRDFEFLMSNWEKECDLIRTWANAVCRSNDVDIKKPENEHTAIEIVFPYNIEFEDMPTTDDDIYF